MIFDAHTHVYPADPRGFWKQQSGVDALIAAMDAAGVDRAAVIAIAPAIPVDIVCDAAKAYPSRLVAIGSVDPSSAEAARDVERQVRDLGVRAIKIHPRLQRISYGDLDTLVPVARACGRARVPLVICSFIGGPDLFKARTLEWCLDLAVAAPETAVILAHAGGYRPLDALLMLKAQPNIHLDLSFSPLYFAGSSVVQDFGYLVRKADPARVLFGSDFPEVSMAASVEWLRGAVQTAGLSASDRDLMFGGNAERLFGRAA